MKEKLFYQCSLVNCISSSLTCHLLKKLPYFVVTLLFLTVPLVQGQTITKVFEGSRTEAPFIQNHFGIAIDADDNVFVGGNRVNVFKISPSGSVTQILEGAATFSDITQLDTDAAGNVFVLSAHRVNEGAVLIKKISPGGVISDILDANGDGSGNSLDHVTSMATDASGHVFVVGVQDNLAKIFSINPANDVAQLLASTGNADDFVAGGIALDTIGNLYVSPKSTFAHKISSQGVVTQLITFSGDGNSHFFQGNINISTLRIRGVATDATGHVYISAWSSNNVFKITPAGQVIQIIDETGDGNGNLLEHPTDIAIDQLGNVFVVGHGSENIFRITPTGVITQVMGNNGDGNSNIVYPPETLAVDSSDNLFVTAGTAIFKVDFSDEMISNEVASFNGSELIVPVVSVGNSFYRVILNLSNAQNVTFQLVSAEILTNPNLSSLAEFNNNTLSIPEVIVGALKYRVTLKLTGSNPFTFELINGERL